MPEREGPLLTLRIDRATMQVRQGTTVAAALLQAGVPCRTSIHGEARAPLCGMGICFECRAVVDGMAHRRTCQLACREGMQVETRA